MTYDEAIKTATEKWQELKDSQKLVDGYGTTRVQTTFGKEAEWNNQNLLWVYLTENEEGHDGSQTYLGLRKNGKVVWEFQSHCSCNYYEDSYGHGAEMPDTIKGYELEGIPEDWKKAITENIEKMLAELNKK